MSPHSEVSLETDVSESTPSLIHGNSTNGNGNGANTTNGVNGHPQTTRHSNKSPYLASSPLDTTYDLICVGFGPASLAIAVALHDAHASDPSLPRPKVLFIEKQHRFAWHAGMLLPGAKMQISFIKDLATLRDPRSEFTFLNYLFRQGRLVDFTNLSTFLPARLEYEDYLRWCASYFEHLVLYGQQVVSVAPETQTKADGAVRSWTVQAQDAQTGQTQAYRGRNVLLATGGQPALPKSFPQKHPRVIHSSQYAQTVPRLLPKRSAPVRVVVVGAGQSAAEIFNNIQTLYPQSQTWLVMRQEFLRPSDDSPFVNSVFNPEYIDTLFPKSAKYRNDLIREARATNYGVVRLELIEELYERQYEQRRELGPSEKAWPHRILGGRHIASVDPSDSSSVTVKVQRIRDFGEAATEEDEETLEADVVIAATGYQRNAHVEMLRGAWDLLPKATPAEAEFGKGITGWRVATEQGERKMGVGRDYRVQFAPGQVAAEAGVWLQGCCEGTHGLSDTLLSVLATRSGELVDSIFGGQQTQRK